MSLHPLEIKIDNEVAEALKRANVTYLFGIPGGGTSIDLIESCNEVGIPFVLVQHETSAAIMAVVCAELTNSCGACISIMGPGAINLASGAGYAFWERHPLLCFTESYGLGKAPKMSIQRIDHAKMFSVFSQVLPTKPNIKYCINRIVFTLCVYFTPISSCPNKTLFVC